MSESPNIIGVIPSRLESTRLPRKALVDIKGKTLIQRVWEQCTKSKILSKVCIATDSKEIEEVAKSFGAEVIMTSKSHPSGTDRIAEAVSKLYPSIDDVDLVVNLQGDVPFMNPELIDRTTQVLLNADTSIGMSTLAVPTTEGEFNSPNDVKVVRAVSGNALYFSRAPIPYWRDSKPESAPSLKHIGLYVYRPDVLMKITKFKQSPLEKAEKLEQLRAMENGIQIAVALAERAELHPNVEVDTPQDLEKALAAATNFDA